MTTLFFTVESILPIVREFVDGLNSNRVFMGEPYETEGNEPMFWLVKDQGIYLMTNLSLNEGEKRSISYAIGCDPSCDDWYDNARAFSADDIAIPIPKHWVFRAYNEREKYQTFAIKFQGDSMTFVTHTDIKLNSMIN